MEGLEEEVVLTEEAAEMMKMTPVGEGAEAAVATLEEVAEIMKMTPVVVEEAAEATQEEAAEKMKMMPVGEGEDLTMQEKTSRTNVAITQLDMVRW